MYTFLLKKKVFVICYNSASNYIETCGGKANEGITKILLL